ncbi:MAG TPA: hypothetical protein V6C76_06960 [Drouetiella sp.]
MKEQPDKLAELIKVLKNTQETEIDCDEFWEKAAYLAETDLLQHKDELRLYLHHLELCPGCAEEFELLKKVIEEGSR